MAKIELSKLEGGFRTLPEGVQVLRIKEVEDKYDDFKKINFTLENKDGITTRNNFDFNRSNNVIKGFTYFVNCATGDWQASNVNTDELVGKFVKCEIVHNKSSYTDKEGNERESTWANVAKTFELSVEELEEAEKNFQGGGGFVEPSASNNPLGDLMGLA